MVLKDPKTGDQYLWRIHKGDQLSDYNLPGDIALLLVEYRDANGCKFPNLLLPGFWWILKIKIQIHFRMDVSVKVHTRVHGTRWHKAKPKIEL